MREIQHTPDLDNVFEALANRHRREIIHILSLRPSSISHLASMRGLTLPAMHKHLTVLENAEMVLRKKVGRTNFLALNREPLGRLQDWVNQFHPYWGSDQETLENYAQHLGKEQSQDEEQA